MKIHFTNITLGTPDMARVVVQGVVLNTLQAQRRHEARKKD